MKHKHYDLIMAWADGAEIEYFHIGCQQWFKETNPLWKENLEYRVKPKEEFLKYRVALHKTQNGKFYTSSYEPERYKLAENLASFVMWFTDEQTVNVGGLR
jgi:hypothetical protein